MISPSNVNLILALLLAFFIVNGLLQGLVHMVGSVIGLIVGIIFASRFDSILGNWIAAGTGWNKDVTVVIAFFFILIIFTRVFGWLLSLLEKSFKILKVPLVSLANRVGGGFLGIVEGVLVIGSTLILITQLPFVEFTRSIQNSAIALALITAAKILLPLVPPALRNIYELKR